MTFIISCALIVGTGCLIALARTHSALLSTVTIILCNTITPFIVRNLTKLESHETETTFASSSYIKVTLIRWVNTVIVTLIITPFTDILQSGKFINSLRLLFTAELLQRPLLQLVDWMGNIKRHIFGPRALNQEKSKYSLIQYFVQCDVKEYNLILCYLTRCVNNNSLVNLWFMASPYDVGERYTEVTKLLFLTFYYCTIFPLGFFYASVILFVYYWIDKFSVLRTWRQGPKINADISLFSTYFLWLTVLAYAVVAAYMYSSFPFDDACVTDEDIPEIYLDRMFAVENGIHAGLNFTITAQDNVYKFCNQDLFRQGFQSFPPIISVVPTTLQWMNPSQEKFSSYYGWVLIGVIVLVVASIILRLFIRLIRPLFWKSYKVSVRVFAFATCFNLQYLPNHTYV